MKISAILAILFILSGCGIPGGASKHQRDLEIQAKIDRERREALEQKKAVFDQIRLMIKRDDQKALGLLAIEKKDYEITIEALKGITNQKVLISIVKGIMPSSEGDLKGRDKEQLAIISRITDESFLNKLIENVDFGSTQEYAESRLRELRRLKNTDVNVLKRLALESPTIDSRISAINAISDQELLLQIAEHAAEEKEFKKNFSSSSREFFYMTIIERLTDQNVLSRIFLNWSIPKVSRFAAARKISDQNILMDLANNSDKWLTQQLIRFIIKDADMLTNIAEKSTNQLARNEAEMMLGIKAVEETNNQDILQQYAILGDDPRVATKAIEKITDQNRLFLIARLAKRPIARDHASSRLTDQKLIAQIALNEKDSSIRKMIIKDRLTDQKLLSEIVLNGGKLSFYEKRDAIEKITNKNLLIKIMQKGPCFYQGERLLCEADTAAYRFMELKGYRRKYKARQLMECVDIQLILSEPDIYSYYGDVDIHAKFTGEIKHYGREGQRSGFFVHNLTTIDITIKLVNGIGDIIFENTFRTEPPKKTELWKTTDGLSKSRSAKIDLNLICLGLLRPIDITTVRKLTHSKNKWVKDAAVLYLR